jgi:hypothetical protein
MHNMDRTANEFESEQFLGDLFETETLDELDEFEYEGEHSDEYESEVPFDEMEESELTNQLMEITDEAELEQFLGGLVSGIGSLLGMDEVADAGEYEYEYEGEEEGFLPLLAGAAKFLVPHLGKALVGIGRKVLPNLLGKGRNRTTARNFVRFAGSAAQRALRNARRGSPQRVVRTAINHAARRFPLRPVVVRPSYAGPVRPGYRRRPYRPYRVTPAPVQYPQPVSVPASVSVQTGVTGAGAIGAQPGGRWVRRGNKIIILGA